MTARHPTRRRLQRWLDTGDPRRVSHHIESCGQCQAALEELSALDDGLVADLQAATTPPDDLRERTRDGVDGRLRNEAALGVFADLFAIGWDVVRILVDPDAHGDAAQDHDGPAEEGEGGQR